MADFSDSTILTETLIGLLDACAPDPDLEDGMDQEGDGADDEPNLGAPNQQAGSWNGIDPSFGCNDDEELELGWTEMEARFNRHFAAGDDVYEPSLGSTTNMNQAHWSKGDVEDREGEGTGNYAGACSPAATMFPQANERAS